MHESQEKPPGYNFIKRLSRHFFRSPEFKKPETFPGKEPESPVSSYQIKKEAHGTTVILSQANEIQGQFFQTVGGQWYLLAHSGVQAKYLEEEQELDPQGRVAQYLSGLVEAAESP